MKLTKTKRELFDYSINPPYSSHSSTTDPMQSTPQRCRQIQHKKCLRPRIHPEARQLICPKQITSLIICSVWCARTISYVAETQSNQAIQLERCNKHGEKISPRKATNYNVWIFDLKISCLQAKYINALKQAYTLLPNSKLISESYTHSVTQQNNMTIHIKMSTNQQHLQALPFESQTSLWQKPPEQM